MFGFGFIPFLYICAFLFKEVEAAFKYVTLPLMVFYGLPHIIDFVLEMTKSEYDPKTMRFFLFISPLSCLSKSLSQLFDASQDELKNDSEFIPRLSIIKFQLFHFVIYFSITILIDHYHINSFKGKDHKK